jgi:hypothetical protein
VLSHLKRRGTLFKRRAARPSKRRGTIVALAGLLLATSALGTLGGPASALGATRASQPAQLESGPLILLTTYRVTPKIKRTVHFTGYATYVFKAPKGRRIVNASARIVGAEAHAVAIRTRTVSHKGTRYTVSLIFPGEQGNPGKLVVRLGSVA